MSDTPTSLILPPANEPSLPGMPDPVFFQQAESKGEFTAERLRQQRPDTYKAVVVLLGQRLGVIRIGKLLQVSPNTVMAVRDREGAAIDIVKEHLSTVAHAGATLASEAIVEALNNIAPNAHNLGVKDLKDLAVVYGILVQNGQLLAGQPTARVEVTDLRQPEHDAFNAYIAGLPQVIAIDSSVEKSGVKEPAVSGDVAAPGATDLPPMPADSESAGPASQPTEGQGT